MNIGNIQITYLILGMALLASQDAMAAKIYQWTDEEGVVQYSDVPPGDNTSTEIKEINFNSYAANDIDPDEYSIVNQLERMAEWRRQTEEERLARKQLQLEEQRLAQERNSYRLINPYSTRAYYPSTYYYPYPGNFGAYNKWHGNHWGGHFGSGHGNHGNFTNSPPQYLLDQYKVGSRF